MKFSLDPNGSRWRRYFKHKKFVLLYADFKSYRRILTQNIPELDMQSSNLGTPELPKLISNAESIS